jgi:hypothetical protein
VKMAVFWVVALRGLVWVNQRFVGPYCLHHQGLLKRWCLHGGTTQKTAIFIVTAMRASSHI